MDELKQIEQRLYWFSPDALIAVDADGVIVAANDTVKTLLGHAPDALVGRSIDVLLPHRFIERHGAHFANYLRAPQNREMGARIADLFARRADGSEFPAGIRLAPFEIDGKRYVAAAIRDMTERRRASDALVAAREEADRANRAKSRFLAIASHDLRQPLQTISLLNAAMQRMSPDTRSLDLLRQQTQAIDGMTRLLNELLDVTRLESGAIEPHVTAVRLSDVLDELRAEFEPIAQARGIELKIASTSAVLSTDRTLLHQLLQNVLANAVKFTDRGSVTIAFPYIESGFAIDIEDTGVGIPEDKLERIFDEYYQVESRRGGGVGLGLAIVREVSRLLHLEMKVTSRVGVGTRVRVSMPRAMLDAVDRPQDRGRYVAPTATSGRGRVFLIEDVDSVRAATQLFLELEGHQVSSFASAAEAEREFEAFGDSDLLIADFHLDGRVTGLDVVQSLSHRLHRAVPAIIMSGDLPNVLRGVRTPPPNVRFLGKPVDVAALTAAIDELRAGRA